MTVSTHTPSKENKPSKPSDYVSSPRKGTSLYRDDLYQKYKTADTEAKKIDETSWIQLGLNANHQLDFKVKCPCGMEPSVGLKFDKAKFARHRINPKCIDARANQQDQDALPTMNAEEFKNALLYLRDEMKQEGLVFFFLRSC